MTQQNRTHCSWTLADIVTLSAFYGVHYPSLPQTLPLIYQSLRSKVNRRLSGRQVLQQSRKSVLSQHAPSLC